LDDEIGSPLDVRRTDDPAAIFADEEDVWLAVRAGTEPHDGWPVEYLAEPALLDEPREQEREKADRLLVRWSSGRMHDQFSVLKLTYAILWRFGQVPFLSPPAEPHQKHLDHRPPVVGQH